MILSDRIESMLEKVQKAHTISNYPGLGPVGGAQMQKAFLDHLAQMEIEITEDKITLINSTEIPNEDTPVVPEIKAVEMHVSRLGISKRGAERKTPPGKPLNGATRRKRKAVAMAVATHPQNAPGAQIDGKNGAQDECGDCERRCKRSLTCPREVDAASNCGR